MNDNVLNEITKIIDGNIEHFLQDIKWKVSSLHRRIIGDRTDFPVFRPANKEFFDYLTCEKYLEWKIREYLVSDILCSLFNNVVISPNAKALKPAADKEIIIRTSYSNEKFGEDKPFAFIIQTSQDRIGIRYSGLYYSKKEIRKCKLRYKVSHIEVIDWSDTEAFESQVGKNACLSQIKSVQILTLRKFFSKYFSDDAYKIYIAKVREAVEEANNLIGFQTIPSLSLRYISDFKNECLNHVADLDISNLQYYKFDETGKVTTSVSDSISKDDYLIMNQVFSNEGLFKSLVGDEKFARCFITAEYLYSVYKTRDAISFDYTSVVVGYFKSIELLLYKIMKIWLDKNLYKELWIAGGKPKMASDQKDLLITEPEKCFCRWNPAPKANGTQVRFDKEYEKWFSTEMGALVWFIYDNSNGWRISEQSKDIIRDCLLNYKQGCRNDFLHKAVIGDRAEVECIRSNTLLCLYYILGGCVITGNIIEDKRVLGLSDKSYEKLFKVLYRIPLSDSCFLVQLSAGESILKLVRVSHPDTFEYDGEGNISTQIEFKVVEDFLEAKFNTESEFESFKNTHESIVISHDSVPYRIWCYNKAKGQNEIFW